MAHVINRLQRAALDEAVQRVSSRVGASIFTMWQGFHNNAPMQYGVNWSCWGTQDAETTEQFAQSLIQAARIAKMLTDLELAINYCDDPEVEGSEETEKKWRELLFELMNQISMCSSVGVLSVLEMIKRLVDECTVKEIQ